MDYKDIIPFIEPIFRFCYHRLNSRFDAEDLASEIFCHVLEGVNKYKIESLEAWIWRIAHNRYARFLEERKRHQAYISDKELYEVEGDYCQVDEALAREEYEPVFRALHTLSSRYRDIFVDYYIGEMSIKQLARRYSLPESTVKWRLNVGRGKIRDRIGEDRMDKVYQRINWNTKGCNGSMDSHKYLHTQIARAICLAAYEKPLTVEEISLDTGIPTLYLEDELPRLEYGDAVRKAGNKYGTDFIIFRQEDRRRTETILEPMIKRISDYYEQLLREQGGAVKNQGFYGCQFGMGRLGYIVIPYFIRKKIRDLKENRLNMPNGNFPPRKDGGYGWFLVEETVDEEENVSEYRTGCNMACDDSGGRNVKGCVYYYWMNKYFDVNLYHNGGTKWLCAKGIPRLCQEGVLPEGMLGEEDILRLLQMNLVVKEEGNYLLNFPCFSRNQFDGFMGLFRQDDGRLDNELSEWLLAVRRSLEGFVPRRLHAQVNQWVACYAGEVVGNVLKELICRGVLEQPQAPWREEQAMGKPLVNGIFYVEGGRMLI